MFNEQAPAPEQREPELQREKELHDLAEYIQAIPDPSESLWKRVDAQLASHLEEKGRTELRRFWLIYKDNRDEVLRKGLVGRSEVELSVPGKDEPVTVSAPVIREIEDYRASFADELRPVVNAELREAPYVATRGPVMRGVQRCPECNRFVPPAWRLVVKNRRENPVPIDTVKPGWSDRIAMGKLEISQEHRFVSYLELHELQEHPSTARVDVKDLRRFLSVEP